MAEALPRVLSLLLMISLSSFESMCYSTQPHAMNNSAGHVAGCHLHPMDEDIHELITKLVTRSVKLIEYKLTFPHYRRNPLKENMTYAYKADKWQRAFSKHGTALVALPYHFEIMSLTMLSFGVEKLTIGLDDHPHGCMQKLSEKDKLNVVTQLVINDFLVDQPDDLWLGDEDYVCHQIVEDANGVAHFTDRCCMKRKRDGYILCKSIQYDPWIDMIQWLIRIVKVGFYLLAPAFFLPWLKRTCPSIQSYQVHLETPVVKTVYIEPENQKSRTKKKVKDLIKEKQSEENIIIFDESIPKQNAKIKSSSYSKYARIRTSLNMAEEVVDKPLKALKHSVKCLTDDGQLESEFVAAERDSDSSHSPKENLKHCSGRNRSDNKRYEVEINKLHLLVDHSELIPQNWVPAGFMYFIYHQIIRCGLSRSEPFASCSTESFIGSWSDNFLWFPFRDFFRLGKANKRVRAICNWGILCRGLGGFLLFLIIPFPFYIRIIVYYFVEDEEITSRLEKASSLGLRMELDHNAILYSGAFRDVTLIICGAYVLAFVVYALLRARKPRYVSVFMEETVEDLANRSIVQCFRLLIAHLLLPIEKFGLCGCFLGLIYWSISVPICFAVLLIYMFPTIYLTLRFLLQNKPNLLETFPRSDKQREHDLRSTAMSVSAFKPVYEKQPPYAKVSNINNALLLHEIAPCEQKVMRRRNNVGYAPVLFRLVLGLSCVILLYTVLFFYAECFGLLVEVTVFTLMGTVVNAAVAARYVTLLFYVCVYTYTCFESNYNDYLSLNQKLFSFVVDKCGDDVKKLTQLRHRQQKNVAFKYFNSEDVEKDLKIMMDFVSSGNELNKLNDLTDSPLDDDVRLEWQPRRKRMPCGSAPLPYDLTITWKCMNVVLFVDDQDVLRIPKKLFIKMTEVVTEGSPGPVYLGILRAFRQLMYMIIFLLFVMAVVMTFGNMYTFSSTNQMLMTLAGGFLPFVLRFVLVPPGGKTDLNSHTLEGKMLETVRTYRQTWPAYDLSFTKRTDASNNTSINEKASQTELRVNC